MWANQAGLIILTWTGCTVLKKVVQHPAAAGLALRFAALGSWLFGVMKVIIFQARCWRSRRLGIPTTHHYLHHQTHIPDTPTQTSIMMHKAFSSCQYVCHLSIVWGSTWSCFMAARVHTLQGDTIPYATWGREVTRRSVFERHNPLFDGINSAVHGMDQH